MNRRSFFRLGAGLAGAAAVAPKVLLEPVAAPVAAELAPVVYSFSNVNAVVSSNAGEFYGVGEYNFYGQLLKLCQQFFGNDGHSFIISERLQPGIVDIAAPQLSEEDLFFFKKCLFYIRPVGVLVNLNNKSALLPYDFMDIENPGF